jgi:hypothetical protein
MNAGGPASIDLQVRRGDLRDLRVVEAVVPGAADLAPGQAVLGIERFALTANNVTYAVFGDAPSLEYWRFFPAPEGWGRVPVWGFATAVASTHPAVSPGDRFYGFLPMSTHLVVEPAAAPGVAGFVDGAAHRAGLSPVYNTYLRAPSARPGDDPAARAAIEAEQMLMRPLFTTAFLIDDFLADEGFFGARRVLLSSASSKTAYGTAFMLAARGGVERIGLTSAAHRAFVEGLGCYDRVLAYDEIDALEPDVPTVYVDMSGDAGLRSVLHHRLGDALRHDCAVGGTHWERVGRAGGARPAPLPGPRPVMFFAPGRWEKRAAEWGEAGFARRLGEARDAFGARLRGAGGWMTVEEGAGPGAVAATWRDLVDGRGRPQVGHVLSLEAVG